MTCVTTTDLLAASSTGIRTMGQYFETTRNDYEKAETQFDTDVSNPMRSGHAWKGEGVPNATMVAETNASALAASKVTTETAWLALDGLSTAVHNAQTSLNKTLTEASNNFISVADDGTATVNLPTPIPGVGAPPEGQRPTSFDPNQDPELMKTYQHSQEIRDRIEREAKGYLAFATIADKSCSGILDKVAYLSPCTTDEANPDTLAHNGLVLAGALSTRNLALLTRNFWEQAQPKAVPEHHDGWSIDKIAVDVVGIGGCTVGLLTSLGEDATGVAAVFGAVQGTASAAGIYTNFKNLLKDTKGTGNKDDSYKPAPPEKGDELLTDVYETGKVPEKDLDEGGQGFTPDSPSTPGEPPVYDKDGNLIPYKEFTDVGPRKNSNEVLVVDENSGRTYYSDDNGKSFLQVA